MENKSVIVRVEDLARIMALANAAKVEPTTENGNAWMMLWNAIMDATGLSGLELYKYIDGFKPTQK